MPGKVDLFDNLGDETRETFINRLEVFPSPLSTEAGNWVNLEQKIGSQIVFLKVIGQWFCKIVEMGFCVEKSDLLFMTSNKRTHFQTKRFTSPISFPGETSLIYEMENHEDGVFQNIEIEGYDCVDGDIDAEYKLFLEQFRVDGQSNVFEKKRGDAKSPLYFRNRGEDGSNHLQFEARNKRKFLQSENSMPKSKSPPGETFRIRKMGSSLGNDENERHKNIGIKVNDFVDVDADAEFKLFLKHLRVDEKSYVLEMKIGDAKLPLFVKYEGDDDSKEGIQSLTQRSRGIVSRKGSCGVGKKKLKKRSMGPTSGGTVIFQSSPISRCEVGCSLVDDDFQTFIDHVRESCGSMILKLSNKITVKYEGEGQLPSETEDPAAESNRYFDEKDIKPCISSLQPSNPFACEGDGCSIETVRYSESSYFSNELMDYLQKPFDKNEFERLLKLATTRPPRLRQKHLRAMSKTYATSEIGFSYLDHHPDLAKQIRAADCHRGLTLLRGFFFWLKNLCHEGAFRPWVSGSSTYEAISTSIYNSKRSS